MLRKKDNRIMWLESSVREKEVEMEKLSRDVRNQRECELARHNTASSPPASSAGAFDALAPV